MARGSADDRPVDRLEESLCRLRGLAAAVACIGVALEMQADGCLRPDYALQILGEVALDEAEAAEREVEALWGETPAEAAGTGPRGKGRKAAAG